MKGKKEKEKEKKKFADTDKIASTKGGREKGRKHQALVLPLLFWRKKKKKKKKKKLV